MKEFEKYIRKHRYFAYDTLALTIDDLDLGLGSYAVTHQANYKVSWVHLDYPTHTRIITFPTDIVYINMKKGARKFLKYIKGKLGLEN